MLADLIDRAVADKTQVHNTGNGMRRASDRVILPTEVNLSVTEAHRCPLLPKGNNLQVQNPRAEVDARVNGGPSVRYGQCRRCVSDDCPKPSLGALDVRNRTLLPLLFS